MKIIGRTDKADFPELYLNDLAVKIDTGAYTSSIHAIDVKKVELKGEMYVEFKLLDTSYSKYNNVVFKVKNFREKEIKSSFGNIERRFVICLMILMTIDLSKISGLSVSSYLKAVLDR